MKDKNCFTCRVLGECIDPKGCNEVKPKQLTLEL